MKKFGMALLILALAPSAFAADAAKYVLFGENEIHEGSLKAVASTSDSQSAPLVHGTQVTLLVAPLDELCTNGWTRQCFAEKSTLFYRTHRGEAFKQVALDPIGTTVVKNPEGSNSVYLPVAINLDASSDELEVYASFSRRNAVNTGYFDSVGKTIYEPGSITGTEYVSNYGRNFSISVSR